MEREGTNKPIFHRNLVSHRKTSIKDSRVLQSGTRAEINKPRSNPEVTILLRVSRSVRYLRQGTI